MAEGAITLWRFVRSEPQTYERAFLGSLFSCERVRRCNGIVCPDRSYDGDLARRLDSAPQELPEQERDLASRDSVAESKHKLVAPIGVFLPTG